MILIADVWSDYFCVLPPHLTSLPFPSGNSGDLIIYRVIDKTLLRALSAAGKRKLSCKGGDLGTIVLLMGYVLGASCALETFVTGGRITQES